MACLAPSPIAGLADKRGASALDEQRLSNNMYAQRSGAFKTSATERLADKPSKMGYGALGKAVRTYNRRRVRRLRACANTVRAAASRMTRYSAAGGLHAAVGQ